MRKYFCHP